jgi:hypothetical protein
VGLVDGIGFGVFCDSYFGADVCKDGAYLREGGKGGKCLYDVLRGDKEVGELAAFFVFFCGANIRI